MNVQNLNTSQVAYSAQGLTVAFAASASKQLLVSRIRAYNSLAGANAIAIGHSIHYSSLAVYGTTASYTNLSASILSSSPAAISIAPTTNNYGVLFQSNFKFNMVAFNVSQAQTGSPVYTYTYYNGSSMVTLPLLNTPSYAATGTQVILFNAPIDWATGAVGGGDQTKYSIQLLATTAPSQAVQINSIQMGKMLAYSDSVPSKGALNVNLGEKPLLLQGGEGIIPFFSYSNSSNTLEIVSRSNP